QPTLEADRVHSRMTVEAEAAGRHGARALRLGAVAPGRCHAAPAGAAPGDTLGEGEAHTRRLIEPERELRTDRRAFACDPCGPAAHPPALVRLARPADERSRSGRDQRCGRDYGRGDRVADGLARLPAGV